MRSEDSTGVICNTGRLFHVLEYLITMKKIKTMKKISLLLTAISITLIISAQGNSQGKDKDKQKDKTEQAGKDKEKGKGKEENKGNSKEKNKEKEDKEKKDVADHEKKVWEGTYAKEGDGPKPSKNQPTQVTGAFQKDYPNATNVSWSKYRGNWTATFGNGPYKSTAVYHANGERKDTRTPITRDKMPKHIQESILKEKPDTKLDDVVKIETPKGAKEIYRVKDMKDGKPEFKYYDADGKPVKYDY